MLTELIKALQAGQELKNSANWKNFQMMTSALAAVGGFGLTIAHYCGLDLEVNNDQILSIAGGVATILGLCNAGITAATSKKVGLPSRSAIDEVSPKDTD